MAPAADQYLALGCEHVFVCNKQHIYIHLSDPDAVRGAGGGAELRVFLIYPENLSY